MQFPQGEPVNFNQANPGQNSSANSHAHSSPAHPQPHPSPHSSFPNQPHTQYSSHSHLHPYETVHYSRYPSQRAGLFGSWFNAHLPPPPPNGTPLSPHAYYPPQRQHYRFYRRCGGRGRLLPLLIVGGVGYYGYRKLNGKIDGVRSEVEMSRYGVGAEASSVEPNSASGGRVSTSDEQYRRRPWGWHHHRLEEKREAEQRRVEAERKQNQIEAKMKEWEGALEREKLTKKEESSRWI